MVSVLIPSRDRPGMLAAAIGSLRTTATGDTEFLIRVDTDDPQLRLYEQWAENRPYATLIIGQPLGYAGFHEYVNELVTFTTGDYLLLWNDDARMETVGWDTRLYDHNPDDLFVATPGGVDHPFPVMSYGLYEALGHYSQAAHCDHWACEIGKACDIMVSLPVWHIDHCRDRLDDPTKQAGVVAQETITLPLLMADTTRARLARDVALVSDALDAPYGGRAA